MLGRECNAIDYFGFKFMHALVNNAFEKQIIIMQTIEKRKTNTIHIKMFAFIFVTCLFHFIFLGRYSKTVALYLSLYCPYIWCLYLEVSIYLLFIMFLDLHQGLSFIMSKILFNILPVVLNLQP